MKIIKTAKTLRSSVINIQHEKARKKRFRRSFLLLEHEASSTSSGVEYLCAHLPCQQPILSYVFCAFQLHTGYCIQVQTSRTGRYPIIQILELKEQVKLNFPNKIHLLQY